MNHTADTQNPASLTEQFDVAIAGLVGATGDERKQMKTRALECAAAILALDGGPPALHQRVATFEAAGLFAGSDWGQPSILQPALAVRSLRQGDAATTAIEALSELRLLAVANGEYFHAGI